MAEKEVTDELEYHVTFPSPPSPEFTEEEDGSVSETSTISKEPVVILLGWAGCQDKHLKKYSAIYEHRSCITIRYTLPLDAVFLKWYQTKRIAVKLLELLEDLELEENPVFFHVFSNGGSMLYQYIAHLISTSPQFIGIQLRGVIFDSCPGKRRIASAAKALTNSVTLPSIVKYFAIGFVLCFLYVSFCLQFIWNFVRMRKSSDAFWDGMLNDATSCPQLFLYSKADTVILYQDIDEVVEHRKKLGVLVEALCWDDSPHVMHFKVHREAYITACSSFIERNV